MGCILIFMCKASIRQPDLLSLSDHIVKTAARRSDMLEASCFALGQNRLFAGTKFRPVFLQKPTVWAAMLSQRFSACSLLRHRPCLAGGISGLGRARGHALLWKWPELARNTVLSLIQTSPFTKSDDLVIFRTVSRRKAVRVCTKNHRSPSARPRIRS